METKNETEQLSIRAYLLVILLLIVALVGCVLFILNPPTEFNAGEHYANRSYECYIFEAYPQSFEAIRQTLCSEE